jgi:hypothetical protein
MTKDFGDFDEVTCPHCGEELECISENTLFNNQVICTYACEKPTCTKVRYARTHQPTDVLLEWGIYQGRQVKNIGKRT